MSQTKGRVTIPTNLDVVPETIELMKRWGADAIRDCDGTEFPEELTKTGATSRLVGIVTLPFVWLILRYPPIENFLILFLFYCSYFNTIIWFSSSV